MKFWTQTTALLGLSARNLPRRPWQPATTVTAVALVVLVLLAFLSMREGFRRTLENAGSPSVALILREGAENASASSIGAMEIAALANANGIRTAPSGAPILSPEIVLPVAAVRPSGDEANLILRGVEPASPLARSGLSLVAGRMPREGTRELLVGRAAAREFAGLDLNQDVELGGHRWRVVGHFSAGGNAYESEARVDLRTLQGLSMRGPSVQMVRAQLIDPGRLAELQAFLKANPQLRLAARSERQYFEDTGGSGGFIQRLGWPLALIMAIGALAGVANAMYALTAARAREIGTLRAIGFARLPIFAAVLMESLALALAGGLIGVACAWLLFDGLTSSTLSSSLSQLVFESRLSAGTAVQALALALSIGLLGGAAPAWKAARAPLRGLGSD